MLRTPFTGLFLPLFIILLVFSLASPGTDPVRGSAVGEGPGGGSPPPFPAGASSARPGELCLACGQPVGTDDLALSYRGRRVTLHRGPCWSAWSANREALFASLGPRGALFQEPAEPSFPLRDAWFLFGLYVVTGLVAGAACAYLAVGRGLAPIPWFFAGLVANVIPLIVILSRPGADLSRFPAGIPKGLSKVPTTLSPRFCPGCGAENHPAARRCPECRGPLEPTVEPETART